MKTLVILGSVRPDNKGSALPDPQEDSYHDEDGADAVDAEG